MLGNGCGATLHRSILASDAPFAQRDIVYDLGRELLASMALGARGRAALHGLILAGNSFLGSSNLGEELRVHKYGYGSCGCEGAVEVFCDDGWSGLRGSNEAGEAKEFGGHAERLVEDENK